VDATGVEINTTRDLVPFGLSLYKDLNHLDT
jgi:hypothetical protein